jgi:hypothetical protein
MQGKQTTTPYGNFKRPDSLGMKEVCRDQSFNFIKTGSGGGSTMQNKGGHGGGAIHIIAKNFKNFGTLDVHGTEGFGGSGGGSGGSVSLSFISGFFSSLLS